jgi:Fe-S-cluster containining protein
MTEGMQTRVLGIHADYRCRHSGACCSSGWAIPVEPEVEGGLRRLRRAGLREAEGRTWLATDSTGRCAFFEPERGNLCAAQRQLDHAALPSACRHFPRMVLLSPRGAEISLSHYCPTAASMLFRADRGLQIETSPAAFPHGVYEGLDARDAWPPLLRPGVLMGWRAYWEWEAQALALLDCEEHSPEAALAILWARADEARAWRADAGAFEDWLPGALAAVPNRAARQMEFDHSLALHEEALACVPVGLALRRADPGLGDAESRFLAPGWREWSRPIRRYLAAKVFASWSALQGEGLRTTVRSLEAALGTLRVEAARACGEAERPLDAELLKQAFRQADLILCHLARPDELAHRWSRAER